MCAASHRARQQNDSEIDSQHVLFGITTQQDAEGLLVLTNLGINLDRIAAEGERQIARLTLEQMQRTPSPPQTGRVHRLMRTAIEEARLLNHDVVETGHFLLAMLRPEAEPAYKLLTDLGVTYTVAKKQMVAQHDAERREPASATRMQRLLTPPLLALASATRSLRHPFTPEFDPEIVDFSRNPVRFRRTAGSLNFRDEVRDVFVRVLPIAKGFCHNHIGSTHLALALLERECAATRVLRRLGVDASEIRSDLERFTPRGSTPHGRQLPQTPDVRRAIAIAIREASDMGSKFIGTEHLLLGLAQNGGVLSSMFLEDHCVPDLRDVVRRSVIE